MTGFKEKLTGALSWLTKGLRTPVSGSKRKRDVADNQEDQRAAQAARAAAQPSVTGVDELKSSQAAAAPSAGLAPGYSGQDPVAINGQLPAEPAYASYGFDMADRVRELSPLQANKHAVPNGGVKGWPITADPYQQQPQPVRQLGSARQAQHESAAPAPVFGAAAAGLRISSQLPVRPQQPQVQQLQGPAQPSVAHAAGPSQSTLRGPYNPPSVGRFYGGPPSQSGFRPATPRQLFATPDTTRRQLDNLRLGSATPRGPAGSAAAAGPQSRPGMQATTGSDSYYPASSGRRSSAVAGFGGGGGAASASAGASAFAGPTGLMMPPPPRQGTESAFQVQQSALHHHLQQQQQLPLQQRLPFPMSLALGVRELVAARAPTSEELLEWVRIYEASQRPRVAVAPMREDGGYVAGDDDEASTKTTAKAKEARAVLDRLRRGVAAAAQKASADPRVAAAAVGSQAARTALAASQAAAGADTVEAISLKIAAHEQTRQRLHAEAEEATRRQLEALKAQEAAQRAELEQQQQRRRQELGLPPASPHGPEAATAAAAAPRGGPALGRAAPAKAKPPPPAADGDVLDLVSGDEEEEEEAEAGEEQEAGEEGAEDDSDPYGVEYGSYPSEEHGGGNPALRYASRAERSTWRRTMDAEADQREMMVDFRPNNVCVVEIPRSKLQCMDLGVWLNDEMINLYMLLLQARDTRLRQGGAASPAAPRCHFFNSFFYNKLFQDERSYNYANVRRWTTPKQLSNKLQASSGVLELDRIIMPIHKGVHWTCAEVDIKARAVRYYDSLKGEDHALARHLLSWVEDEAADKLKQRWDTSKWSVEFPKDIPQQRNGCDCGVFSIMFADRRGAGLPFDFSQPDMPLLRIKVLHRVVQMRVD